MYRTPAVRFRSRQGYVGYAYRTTAPYCSMHTSHAKAQLLPH